jgi:hypothetical protein
METTTVGTNFLSEKVREPDLLESLLTDAWSALPRWNIPLAKEVRKVGPLRRILGTETLDLRTREIPTSGLPRLRNRCVQGPFLPT